MSGGIFSERASLGLAIPKSNGKTRLLGIPTVTDRLLKQAVHQMIMPLFEAEFKEHNYGFRPNRIALQAVLQAQQYIHTGHKLIVDIDLKRFLPEADGSLYPVAAIVSQGKMPLYPSFYFNPKTAIVGEVYGTEGQAYSTPEYKVGLRWEPNDYIIPAITYSSNFEGGLGAGLEIGIVIFAPQFLKKEFIKNNSIEY